jgi:isochorismate synthase
MGSGRRLIAVLLHVSHPSSLLPTQAPATPVVFLSEHSCVVGEGIKHVLPARRDEMAARAATFFSTDAGRDDGLLLGAIPFAAGRSGRLIAPRHLTNARIPNLGAASDPAVRRVARTVRLAPSGDGYRRRVAAVLQQINRGNGDLRKVVLGRRLTLEFDVPIDPLELIGHLQRDPQVTTFCLPIHSGPDSDPEWFVGATPELLIAKAGARIHSEPLAGSARRHADPSLDRHAAEELARSDKDRREHAAVVEWIADRLSPYCRDLNLPSTPALTSTATMWHLGTSISGELRDPETSSLELAAVLHPTPAVCGLPYGLAMDAIAEQEPFDRGFYGGVVGWCSANGDGRWMVAIRCAEIAGSTARLFAGAGIVSGSDPGAEFDETSAKLVTLLQALGVDEATASIEDGAS